jgi:hypothetical protein
MKTDLNCKFGPDRIRRILMVDYTDDGRAGRESTHFWCEDGQEIVSVRRGNCLLRVPMLVVLWLQALVTLYQLRQQKN